MAVSVRYWHPVAAPMAIYNKSDSRRRPSNSRTVVVMSTTAAAAADNHISLNTNTNSRVEMRLLPSTTSKPRRRTKVYEDGSKGIVCYKEENGEITCEGIDEGPRFSQRCSIFAASTQREVEIIQLLQTTLLRMVEGDRFLN